MSAVILERVAADTIQESFLAHGVSIVTLKASCKWFSVKVTLVQSILVLVSFHGQSGSQGRLPCLLIEDFFVVRNFVECALAKTR